MIINEYPRFLINFNLVATTILLFDHIITLSDEVEYIWRKKMTPFSILFLLNRYIAPVTISIHGSLKLEFSPMFSYLIRDGKVVVLPNTSDGHSRTVIGFATLVTVSIAELMSILRVYAVYYNCKVVPGLLSLVWLVHVALMTWVAFSFDIKLGNTLMTSFATPKIITLSWILPGVILDTLIVGFLTLGLYMRSRTYGSRVGLVKLVIRDGLLYFTVVFATNISWIVNASYWKLPNVRELDPISNLPSSGFVPMDVMAVCLTVTMISRLTLNLRKYDPQANEVTLNSQFFTTGVMFHTACRRETYESS